MTNINAGMPNKLFIHLLRQYLHICDSKFMIDSAKNKKKLKKKKDQDICKN